MASPPSTTSIPLQEPVFRQFLHDVHHAHLLLHRAMALLPPTMIPNIEPTLEPTRRLSTHIFWVYRCFYRCCEFSTTWPWRRRGLHGGPDAVQPPRTSPTCCRPATGCLTWPFQALVHGSYPAQEKIEGQSHSQSTCQTPSHFEQITFALTKPFDYLDYGRETETTYIEIRRKIQILLAGDLNENGQDGNGCSLDVEPDQGHAGLMTWYWTHHLWKRFAAVSPSGPCILALISFDTVWVYSIFTQLDFVICLFDPI